MCVTVAFPLEQLVHAVRRIRVGLKRAVDVAHAAAVVAQAVQGSGSVGHGQRITDGAGLGQRHAQRVRAQRCQVFAGRVLRVAARPALVGTAVALRGRGAVHVRRRTRPLQRLLQALPPPPVRPRQPHPAPAVDRSLGQPAMSRQQVMHVQELAAVRLFGKRLVHVAGPVDFPQVFYVDVFGYRCVVIAAHDCRVRL